MGNEALSPSEYFDKLKGSKHVMTTEELRLVYENCLLLLEDYGRTHQIKAQKKLMFHLKAIEREKLLLERGIDTFVYKTDVDDYIENVKDRVVKIQELENYQRKIPEDIVRKIEACEGIFDKMYVVFTDYTRREERRVKAESRNADPILFGTFQDRNTQSIVERFYFIGDWIDEYCDLTLDKMVFEMSKRGVDIKHDLNAEMRVNLDKIKSDLEKVDPTMNGLYMDHSDEKPPKKFKDRIKDAWKVLKGK